jgi:hypothetical protein
MFSWICPKCGHTVPPSYSECPNCAADTEAVTSAKVEAAPEEAAPAPPVARAPKARPRRAAKSAGLPVWLQSILVAFGLGVVAFLGYYVYRQYGPGKENIRFEEPAAAAASHSAAPRANPLRGYLEVCGLRISESDSKRVEVQFLVVNHSAADVANLAGTVRLRRSTDPPEASPVMSLPLSIASIGPYESREVKAVAETSLRAYELPDWQYLKADLELSSPAQ